VLLSAPLARAASSDGPAKPIAADLGFRNGYGVAFGDAAGGNNPDHLSDHLSGHVPFWFDLGARIYRIVSAGMYLAAGPGVVSGNSCPNNASCSGVDFRLGLQALFHILPRKVVDPWAGVGFGYEVAHTSATVNLPILGQIDNTWTVQGFELMLQLGADYRINENWGVGAFFAFTVGQYRTYSVSINNNQQNGDINNTAAHEWLLFGVRFLWTS
jgi:hypothetical protein